MCISASTTELLACKHLYMKRMLLSSLSLPVLLLLVILLLSGFAQTFCDAAGNHFPVMGRERSIPRLASRFVPNYSDDEPPRMSIENMTCAFFTQPLDHFAPRGKSPTFEQRYCIYDGYATKSNQSNNTARSPILFYTGNESPLEQYINHSGLMWELAPQLQAKVVFVEHRYEGQSLPNLTQNCLAYASTIQALADYADILQLHLNPHSEENDPIAPVIAFGGSYGGMLSAWMRMKYPHLIAGAIAASAPMGAFPQQANHNMDGATRVLAHGMKQSYPPDKATRRDKEQENNHCLTNLLATWPLITWLVREDNRHEADHARRNSSIGLQDPGTFLQEVFRLCEPYTSSNPEPLVRFGVRSTLVLLTRILT
jgi:pimeloyl-ACP methyl ester carboxylesterase